LLSIACLCVVLVGLDGWRSWQTRELLIRADFAETANLARSLTQHAHDTVQAADTILVGLRDLVEQEGVSPAQVERLRTLGMRWIAPLPTLHGLFVFDAQGVMLVNTLSLTRNALNGHEQAYFKYHQTHPDRDVHVDGLIRCVTNCSWVFSVTRRIDAADGSFAGVVMASLSIDGFKQFFATFDKGPHGMIGLLSTRGIVFAREPSDALATGTDTSRGIVFRKLLLQAPVGSFEEIFPYDRIRRFGSYRRVEDYPLVVVVAHGVDDVLANWTSDARLHLSIDLVVCLVLLYVGSRFALQLRRRQSADDEVAALNVRLEAQASTDSLTGLFNRRRFDEKLHQEWHCAQAKQSALSLLFIDVDRFKLFNDRHGHQRGDECLRVIASAIAGTTRRPSDFVARYGGEEIAVLLAETDAAEAVAIGERVRAAIETVGMPHPDNLPLKIVTASVGVATLMPMAGFMTPEALVAAADAALYDAKRKGRNIVVSRREAPASDAVTASPRSA
jgi:diguanylate cyclase (GGDEF)-like protein